MRDGTYNVQALMNEKIARPATLQSTFNEDLTNAMARKIILLDDLVFGIGQDLRRLDDASKKTDERFNILKCCIKFMFGGLVFLFVVVIILVIVFFTK